MRTITLVKKWSGDCIDVVGQLMIDEENAVAIECAECTRFSLDFAMEKQQDGTLVIVAARIAPAPSLPLPS